MSLQNKILIQSRIKLLRRTIIDLLKGTYEAHSEIFSTPFLTIIDKIEHGIDKEIFKKITIVGKRDEKIINRLVIEIDWDKHRILCESQGESFEFDSQHSISDQVSGALKQLSTFIKNAITAGFINKITVHFRYRSDVDHRQANIALGLANISPEEVKAIEEFEEVGMCVEVKPENLTELSILFQTRTSLDVDDFIPSIKDEML